jgi:hypothetical protein
MGFAGKAHPGVTLMHGRDAMRRKSLFSAAI